MILIFTDKYTIHCLSKQVFFFPQWMETITEFHNNWSNTEIKGLRCPAAHISSSSSMENKIKMDPVLWAGLLLSLTDGYGSPIIISHLSLCFSRFLSSPFEMLGFVGLIEYSCKQKDNEYGLCAKHYARSRWHGWGKADAVFAFCFQA